MRCAFARRLSAKDTRPGGTQVPVDAVLAQWRGVGLAGRGGGVESAQGVGEGFELGGRQAAGLAAAERLAEDTLDLHRSALTAVEVHRGVVRLHNFRPGHVLREVVVGKSVALGGGDGLDLPHESPTAVVEGGIGDDLVDGPVQQGRKAVEGDVP